MTGAILAKGVNIEHIGWAGAFVMVVGIIGLCFVIWVFFHE